MMHAKRASASAVLASALLFACSPLYADDDPSQAPEAGQSVPPADSGTSSAPASSTPSDAPGKARSPFSLHFTDAALELGAEYDQRRARYDGGPFAYRSHQTDRTSSYDALFRLGFEGAAPDPDIFSFGGTLGLGLSQERFSEKFNG